MENGKKSTDEIENTNKRARDEVNGSHATTEEARQAAKRAKKAAYDRERRANLTKEQRERRRELDRQRKARQSDDQRAHDRQLHAENERIRLENQTEEERSNRRIANTECQRQRRHRLSENVSQTRQNRAENAIQNETEISEHFCGNLNVECCECGAKHFEMEQYNTKACVDNEGNILRLKTLTKCCKNGQIKLENIREYPEPFLSLMKKQNKAGENFMDNIRSINSSFAFASMGANIVPPKGFGPFCFRIQGQLYHRTGTLHPEDGDKRQFAQLYIIDTEEANIERAKHSANVNVDPVIFRTISDFTNNSNPFCKAYKMLHEVEKECRVEAAENGMPKVKEVTMAIVHDRTKDRRRYNVASANEVAVVFSNTDGLPPLDRDLLIHLRADSNDPKKGMKRINILDKNIDPMTYPLLFPYGEQGWGVDLLRNKTGSRTRISQMEYYAYRLSIRNSFNPLLNAGKLTQQYFVDAYVKMEGNRLSYILNNQKEWRGDTLKGLQDYVANQADRQGKEVGSVVVLPSSFQGGPYRYIYFKVYAAELPGCYVHCD